MKKLIILFIFVTLLSRNSSFADCFTGYACSIDSLKAQNMQKNNQLLNELNDYFELKINEDFMLGKITEELKYKDFFPFSIFVK